MISNHSTEGENKGKSKRRTKEQQFPNPEQGPAQKENKAIPEREQGT
jgi:hypothetical protein